MKHKTPYEILEKHYHNCKERIEFCEQVFGAMNEYADQWRSPSEPRSSKQLKYYWVLMTIMGKELGLTKEEASDIVKFKFLRRTKIVPATGEEIEYLGSISSLPKHDFSELTERIIQLAAEYGIVLPLPEEQFKIEIK